MTYDELLAAMRSLSNRIDLDSDLPLFISMAEDEMKALRVRQMVKRATATIDKAFSEMPIDFAAERVMLIGDDEVDFITIEAMDDRDDGTKGQPRFYTVDAGQFRFYPIPDQAYVFEATYYALIPPLTEAATNWLAKGFPNIYRFGVMWAVSLKTRDAEATAIYKAQMDRAMAELADRYRDKIGRPLRADFSFLQTTRRHGVRL
ncbi:hypothetical protein [uncultured Brevundimonas sp.]|uniref:phage adaptor protein n=1 Tax=uncultured Brevundimonas sp. TaxID=213418 RepID=UPI00260FF6BA|nr:hypothetical protein [uncultured Brevundimonas sp.]